LISGGRVAVVVAENSNSGPVRNLVQAGTVNIDVSKLLEQITGVKQSECPNMLPVDPEHAGFINRKDELDTLDRLWDESREAGAPLVVALSGIPGIGKTLTALRWAHRRCADFDGGVFVADLHGSDPAGPRTPGEILAGFLNMLGMSGGAMPATEDERAAAFREITRKRRVLVVLDDAATAAQVQALLPSSETSAVLVTSRRELTFLSGGVHPMRLDRFEDDAAIELLSKPLGRAGEGTLRRLSEVCGRHPMALWVAAARLKDRASIDKAVEKLASNPLPRLEIDGENTLLAAFELGYDALTTDARHAYRTLGLHPGSEFSLEAAAALLGQDEDDTEDVLGELFRASLVDRLGDGRYGSHALLRQHARARLTSDDDRAAVLRRLVEHYHDFAMARDVVISRRRRLSTRYDAVTPAHTGEDAAERALAELTAEREALTASVAIAAECGLPDRAWQLCETLFPFLNDRGHLADLLEIHEIGLIAAKELDDPQAIVRMLSQHGSALCALGDLDAACERFAAALETAVAHDDAWGEQSAIEWQGLVHERRGEFEQALECFDRSVAVVKSRFPEDRRSRPTALYRMHSGRVLIFLDRFDEAIPRLRAAHERFTELGEVANRAKTAVGLGWVNLAGDLGEAKKWGELALELFGSARMPRDMAETFELLAEVSARTGDVDKAAEHRREASDIRAVLGDRSISRR
jgi:tetratricopeptide (TPR) repeat protein